MPTTMAICTAVSTLPRLLCPNACCLYKVSSQNVDENEGVDLISHTSTFRLQAPERSNTQQRCFCSCETSSHLSPGMPRIFVRILIHQLDVRLILPHRRFASVLSAGAKFAPTHSIRRRGPFVIEAGIEATWSNYLQEASHCWHACADDKHVAFEHAPVNRGRVVVYASQHCRD